MVWSLNDSCGHESAKIAALAVPYLQGDRVLDLGAGNAPVWPSVIPVDNFAVFGAQPGIKSDIADLSMFSDGSIDAVFSSHAVEDFERSQVPALLREWGRVLKVGGHLVIYCPSANLYPKIGEPGANPHHRWDIYHGDPERILKANVDIQGYGWELLESEERNGTNEYSLLVVVRKIAEPEWRENVWQRNPDGKKRALVIRYGAIGDAIIASSIFPLLQEQGYHVTLNCQASTFPVVQHDPHIDAFIVQGKDFVPNAQLAPYWASLEERYDTIINLCESIEGSVLTMQGRLPFDYTDQARRALFGKVNYLERTHDIAGVPHVFNPRFYPTEKEAKWAKALIKAYTGGEAPIILIALAGSSLHKIYPHYVEVISWLLTRTQAHVVLTGDGEIGAALQAAIVDPSHYPGLDTARIHPMAGKWTIRETLSFAQHCDVVVGPETGVLNSVSHAPGVKKVLMLSHSSAQNIGGAWPETIVLAPDAAAAPCFPCHRLHQCWTFCHKSEETNAAVCATALRPETVFDAIMRGLAAAKLPIVVRRAACSTRHP